MADHVGVGRPAPEYVPTTAALDQLHLDDGNPRLPNDVERSFEGILDWLLRDSTIVNLMTSIATQGYFPGEPVLVSPLPDNPEAEQPPQDIEGQDLVVVEGNRRLVAVLVLRNPDIATRRQRTIRRIADGIVRPLPDRLPVIVFAKRFDILDYLGYRHIVGIKEWDPLEKARYLRQLAEREREQGHPPSNHELAQAIGSNAAYVGKLLASLAAFERLKPFFDARGISPEELPFSLFYTTFNYQEIPQFLGLSGATDETLAGLNEQNLERLAKWLFVELPDQGRTPLGESRNMRYLSRAVSVDRGIEALDAGTTVEQAAAQTVDPKQLFSGAIAESRRNLDLARSQVEDLNGYREDTDVSHLQAIHGVSAELLQRLGGSNGPSS